MDIAYFLLRMKNKKLLLEPISATNIEEIKSVLINRIEEKGQRNNSSMENKLINRNHNISEATTRNSFTRNTHGTVSRHWNLINTLERFHGGG